MLSVRGNHRFGHHGDVYELVHAARVEVEGIRCNHELRGAFPNRGFALNLTGG